MIGDRFQIETGGDIYVYEVRETVTFMFWDDHSNILRPQLTDWVTLLTCEEFNAASQRYNKRRAVFAELVAVR